MILKGIKKGIKKVLGAPKGIVKGIKNFATRVRQNPVGAVLGLNYCGPGTKLEGQKATNQTDKICKSHDYDYNRINQMASKGFSKERIAKAIRKADNAMLKRLDRDVKNKDMGYHISKGGIWLKTKLEDAGLLDPFKFAGGKGSSYTAPEAKEEEGDYQSSLVGSAII